MGKSVHNEETRKLMEGILKLQSVEECYAFFEDLCTVNELLSLGQRFLPIILASTQENRLPMQ